MTRYYIYIAKLLFSITSLCLISNLTYASQTTKESEVLIEELLGQINATVAAISQVERKAGNEIKDIHILLDIPAKQSPNVGLVLDINDKQGYRVLSVSPGGLAEAHNIATGDLITSINNVKTTQADRLAYNELEDIAPGDAITFGLKRNGQNSIVRATVEGYYTPPIKLELGTAPKQGRPVSVADTLANSNVDNDNESVVDLTECGTVSVFFRPPSTKQLHSAFINKIDDRNVIRSDASFNLSPGKHTIYLHELIDDAIFTRRSSMIQKAKPIEIDVKKNTTYYLAAQFIKKNRYKERKGEYWEPVVWKLKENSMCEL